MTRNAQRTRLFYIEESGEISLEAWAAFRALCSAANAVREQAGNGGVGQKLMSNLDGEWTEQSARP